MPPIRLNAAKRKLQENGVVTTISGNLTSEIIDFMGPLGFDAVWSECEHGGVTWEQLGDMTRACDLWGLTPITRVNSNEPWLITRTLDRGSMGIVLPTSTTAPTPRRRCSPPNTHLSATGACSADVSLMV